MSRFGLCSAFVLTLCLVPAAGSGLLAQGFDPLWFLHSERRPVYAPAADSQAASVVVQTSHETYAGCVSGGSCGPCDSSGCNGCLGGGASRWELWREHIRCRLRRHHWEKGFETCYPVCPPQCQEYYGYRPTCWRRLPPFDPCPPPMIVAPAPHQAYAPPLQPETWAPPAPADLIAPPAPGDEFP